MKIGDFIKKFFPFLFKKIKRLATNNYQGKDAIYYQACQKEGRMEEFEEYLFYKKQALADIARFQKYLDDPNQGDKQKWNYWLKKKKRELEFIRPHTTADINERNDVLDNFYKRFKEVIPQNLELRFHGTPIYNAKAILESGGIFSSVDINERILHKY